VKEGKQNQKEAGEERDDYIAYCNVCLVRIKQRKRRSYTTYLRGRRDQC
jgi:hypothetical protein